MNHLAGPDDHTDMPRPGGLGMHEDEVACMLLTACNRGTTPPLVSGHAWNGDPGVLIDAHRQARAVERARSLSTPRVRLAELHPHVRDDPPLDGIRRDRERAVLLPHRLGGVFAGESEHTAHVPVRVVVPPDRAIQVGRRAARLQVSRRRGDRVSRVVDIYLAVAVAVHTVGPPGRAEDLKSDLSKALRRSTDGMEQAHAEWKAVRRAWQGYLVPRPANPSLRQQHLTLVTVGLGRLLYANPLWTPAPQNAAPSMTLDAIAPTPTDMAPLIQATLDAFEALMVIARRDRRDVSHARRRNPSLAAEVRGALAEYKELNRPKTHTSWALSEAALLAADPDLRPALWQDINLLELRRDPAAFTRRTTQQRPGTREHLEWLASRTAVSDTRVDLSAIVRRTASSAAPVPPHREPAQRGTNRRQ